MGFPTRSQCVRLSFRYYGDAMKELSLNILDIVENSVKAKATLTEILLCEKDNLLTVTIRDDGCGMDESTLLSVTNPFYTTRTTRKVGLGIPLYKLAAEQTGGEVRITSTVDKKDGSAHGTCVVATFYTDHVDFAPLGDIVATLVTLLQGHPDTDFLFVHEKDGRELAVLDTRAMREILGEDVPLDTFEVIVWVGDMLREQYEESKK